MVQGGQIPPKSLGWGNNYSQNSVGLILWFYRYVTLLPKGCCQITKKRESCLDFRGICMIYKLERSQKNSSDDRSENKGFNLAFKPGWKGTLSFNSVFMQEHWMLVKNVRRTTVYISVRLHFEWCTLQNNNCVFWLVLCKKYFVIRTFTEHPF